MTEAAEPPIAVLKSGQSVTLDEIKLFPEAEVQKLIALRAEAAQLLGGVSTGIGFLGSPEWAIGGALALGLLERAASSSMRTKASQILQDASAQQELLLSRGQFFNFELVVGISMPTPPAWSGSEEWGKRFVHFDQEFLPIRNSSGEMFIRWPDVSAFRPGKLPPKPAKTATYYTNAELAALRKKGIPVD